MCDWDYRQFFPILKKCKMLHSIKQIKVYLSELYIQQRHNLYSSSTKGTVTAFLVTQRPWNYALCYFFGCTLRQTLT